MTAYVAGSGFIVQGNGAAWELEQLGYECLRGVWYRYAVLTPEKIRREALLLANVGIALMKTASGPSAVYRYSMAVLAADRAGVTHATR